MALVLQHSITVKTALGIPILEISVTYLVSLGATNTGSAWEPGITLKNIEQDFSVHCKYTFSAPCVHSVFGIDKTLFPAVSMQMYATTCNCYANSYNMCPAKSRNGVNPSITERMTLCALPKIKAVRDTLQFFSRSMMTMMTMMMMIMMMMYAKLILSPGVFSDQLQHPGEIFCE